MTIAQLVAKHGVHLTLMRETDAQFLGAPRHGSRRMTRQMTRRPRRQGHDVNRKRIRRLMIKMGVVAVYQRQPDDQKLAA